MKKRQVVFADKNRTKDRVTALGYLGRTVSPESGKDITYYVKVSATKAIAMLGEGWEFFVYKDEQKTWLQVANSSGQKPYLKTEKDTDAPYFLLSLPNCPELDKLETEE